jgi:hypothetical protein
MEHSTSGRRGASDDKNRLLRNDFTNSQQNPFVTTETACHFLLLVTVMSAVRDVVFFT